jgi:4-amino-4-deoxy-L-arabinose transferase-like glycosyltransferase
MGHFWFVSGTAYPKIPLVFTDSDMFAFVKWADAILAGDWLGRDTYHPYFSWMKEMAPLETWYRWWGGKEIFQQAPLYPYWLAALLALSNHSLEMVLLVQLLIGAVQPAVMYAIGRRLFDERVGLAAAALTASYGPFIFHQGTLLRDWLPPILEPLFLLLVLRAWRSKHRSNWLLAGAALGLAVLTKPTALLMLPIILLWLAFDARRNFRHAVVPGAALLLGLFIVLSPLLVRNQVVGAPLFAISNRAAEGFITANAHDAFPIGLKYPASMVDTLERSNGRLVGVVLETFRNHQVHWPSFTKLLELKIRGLIDPLEVPNNLDFYYGVELSPALRFALRYGAIFPIGVFGFLLSLRHWRRHLPLMLYGLAGLVGLMGTTINARYRLIFVPVLIVYGAVGTVRLLEAVWSRRWSKAMTCLVIILGVAVVQHFIFPVPILRKDPGLMIHGPEYSSSGLIYATEKGFDRAVDEMARFRERARKSPYFSAIVSRADRMQGDYYFQWASHLLEQGDREEAQEKGALAKAAWARSRTVISP